MTRGFKSGFTIVEVVIVISIVAILSSLAVITYSSIRQDSRDAARQGNVTVISEALEKYYEKNGEYPSVASIVNDQATNTGPAVASKLSIPAESLIMPNTPITKTNALTSTPNPTEDLVVYEGYSAENNPACQSDVNAGCDQFTLIYTVESKGETETVESRHAVRIESIKPELEVSLSGISTITASWTPVINATSYELQRSASSDLSSPITTTHTSTSSSVTDLPPNTEYFFRVRGVQATSFSEWSDIQSVSTGGFPAPTGTVTISASMSGANARGTAGGGTCAAGSIERQIHYQVNSGTWQAWTTTSVRDVAATQGHIYNFQARARCTDGTSSGSWVNSTYSAITAPVSSPSGLTITAVMSGANAVGTAGGGTCAADTTMERQIRYNTNGGAYVAYTTGATRSVAATEGYRYTFQQQARCVGLHASSGYVASDTDYVDRPVTAPTGLTISAAMNGVYARGTFGGGACPTGTTLQRQFRYQINANAWSGWTSVGTAWETTGTQGYRYTFQQQAMCAGTYASSGYTASGTAYVNVPISTPAAPGISNSTSGSTTTWTGSGSCPAGTTRYYERRSLLEGGSWGAWEGTTTSNVSTWNTSAQGFTYSRQYRAQCVTTYASSAWSTNSATSSYTRPIAVSTASSWTHVSLGWQHESNCMYYNGCKWRRFNWTNPPCPAGTVYHSSAWNSYVGSKMSWDNGQSSIYRWWTGNSQTSTTTHSIAYGSIQTSHIVEYRSNVPTNYDDVRHKLIFTCRNPTTGKTGTTETYSQMFRYM